MFIIVVNVDSRRLYFWADNQTSQTYYKFTGIKFFSRPKPWKKFNKIIVIKHILSSFFQFAFSAWLCVNMVECLWPLRNVVTINNFTRFASLRSFVHNHHYCRVGEKSQCALCVLNVLKDFHASDSLHGLWNINH